jgi:hypothetical protein
MPSEYISTISINSHIHYCVDAYGVYYDETGHGVYFIDRIWQLALILGRSWEQDIEYYKTQLEWLEEPEEKPAEFDIEMTLISLLIKTDFHEFIHHFLHFNDIENDCCSNHENNSGNCWLCNFT